MKNYIQHDEWRIIEEGFHPEYNRISESLCSIGNGRMGGRGNFEEKYTGDTHLGNYIAGVYYPDKTRVGWWKNGYPEYFAKVLNAANWIGINIKVDHEELDLATCQVKEFKRILNMKEGYLHRTFTAQLPSGNIVKVDAKRFLSIADDEVGAIRYEITPVNFSGTLTFIPYIDFDVENEDSNYDEKFWVEIEKGVERGEGFVTARTVKPENYAKSYESFYVCSGMKFDVVQKDKKLDLDYELNLIEREKFVANSAVVDCEQGSPTIIYKYAANVSSMNYKKEELKDACEKAVARAYEKGFDKMLKEQAAAWALKWQESDIMIKGDVAAQQGIRFNIFQLNQTYTGEDDRLNIGPKGFTGEKYGGSTYWDTEAYCLAFYLSTADQKVSKNLLLYRYKHLGKAIENAKKLGFTNGAALYPMVTINGEECHNEWEITFEEIHRNGAIARAIYDYIRYTSDANYLCDYGLEVLVGIARFWAQRVNWSVDKSKYVMLGVTGPNEYENNVNNNYYTSKLAAWCLQYAAECIEYVKKENPEKFTWVKHRLNLNEQEEVKKWQHIIDNMYFAFDDSLNIYLQQDGYMDKDQILVSDLDPAVRPLNQHWSWDRILRSCFIKQADTLQAIYVFEDEFDQDAIARHFDFYEPRTVHESSLSPCVHAILAAKLGYQDKAYEMYLRTSRLDLDDYNNDTQDGCHTTSMAGTWMAVIQGFGGMRVKDNNLHFNPSLPDDWESFSFKIRFRENLLKITVAKTHTLIENQSENPISLYVFGKEYTAKGKSEIRI